MEVSRKHQKKCGTSMCTHAHATCINVRVSLYKFDSCLIVLLFVRPSRFVSRFGHNLSVTFLSQINSKLQETFSITSLGSPEMIYNACVRACAHVHAQRVKSCTLLLCPFLGQFFKFLRRFLTENLY